MLARAQMREVGRQLRAMGLGMQADLLEQIADVLEPPTFQGVLATLEHPQQWASPKMVEFLARWLTEAADIIRELMLDAEITGSRDTLERARIWLDDHGL